MSKLFNRKEVEASRKRLRNNSTSAEAVLWLKLKNKQLQGRRFRRQYSVGNYVLDFYCPGEKLAIELDGEHHFTPEGSEHDEKRDRFLSSVGIRVLRFENRLVFEEMERVLEGIMNCFRLDP